MRREMDKVELVERVENEPERGKAVGDQQRQALFLATLADGRPRFLHQQIVAGELQDSQVVEI